MASPLERLDQIRDSLINRGLGGSGLTRQAVQRANLPQLGPAIAESRATRASEQRGRLQQFASKVGRQPAITRGGTGGQRGTGFNAANASEVLRTRDGFALRFRTAQGQSSKNFKNLDELKSFLRANREIQSSLFTGGTPLDTDRVGETSKPISSLTEQESRSLGGVRRLGIDQRRQLLNIKPFDTEQILGQSGGGSRQAEREARGEGVDDVTAVQNQLLKQGVGRSRTFVQNFLTQQGL